MQHLIEAGAGQYRLTLNQGETAWDDPIPPEITSNVLGAKTATVISRTSLLAWSLMDLPCVETAHVVDAGWIDLAIKTGTDFDQLSFRFQVADLVFEIGELPAHRRKPARRSISSLRNMMMAFARHLHWRGESKTPFQALDPLSRRPRTWNPI